MKRFPLLALALLAALAACDDGTPLDPDDPTGERPTGLEARYEWALDHWAGTQPVGHPTVVLTWKVPQRWRQEPFRVYGRRSGGGAYTLVATVTSCAEGWCRYHDANVAPGRGYDYYVAVVDERTGRETASPSAVAVDVPAYSRPPRPAAPRAVALDAMVYLHWTDVALPPERIWKYLVFLEERDDATVFFQPGETDGTGFLDALARNGTRYRYSIAAVDVDGHVSERSPLSDAVVPRPDARGELVYAFSDSAQASGFRFDANSGTGQRVPGDSPQAHWRLEADAGGWLLRPLGEVAVADAGRTSALACGPGSDPGCTAVTEAPATGYQQGAVRLAQEHTYVLRLGSGANERYAKLRVQILGFGSDSGRRLMIFDWAFQTRPGERRLNLGG